MLFDPTFFPSFPLSIVSKGIIHYKNACKLHGCMDLGLHFSTIETGVNLHERCMLTFNCCVE